MSFTKKDLIDALEYLPNDAIVNVMVGFNVNTDHEVYDVVNVVAVGTGDAWKTADIMVDIS